MEQLTTANKIGKPYEVIFDDNAWWYISADGKQTIGPFDSKDDADEDCDK